MRLAPAVKGSIHPSPTCKLRSAAWDALCEKDTPQHRDAYNKTCALVDRILDER